MLQVNYILITYYPKIELAGCYSMTPVREFFEMCGVNQFYSLDMTNVENLFLYNGNLLDYMPNTVIKSKSNKSNMTAEDIAIEETLLSMKIYNILFNLNFINGTFNVLKMTLLQNWKVYIHIFLFSIIDLLCILQCVSS